MSYFDKEKFAELLEVAKGDRSLNQFALHVDVSSAHISRLIRQKLLTPPNPDTIKKIASKANNGITYEMLMSAAGHLSGVDLVGMSNDGNIVTAEAKQTKERKKPKDLIKLLEQEEYTLNGELATPEDKERIKRIVEAMYWDAKEKNKRK